MAESESEGTQTTAVRPAHRLDEARLADYLRAALPGAGRDLRVQQFAYGQSNPTYLVRLGDAEYVLRKQPPGELLPSAHAVDREFRVQKALHGAGLPIAEPILYCDDRSVVGTPFYLMQRMVGRVFTDNALPGVTPAERRAMYDSLADTLARLHAVDPAAVGLGDFGRPGNYFARQIDRWSRNYRATKTGEIPSMDRLMDWLPANIPPGDEAAVIHGDYRVGNVMYHPTEPRIVAVFDWELSTLGHPLSDLAHCCTLFWTGPDAFNGIRGLDPALGLPSEAEFVARYCATAGRADGLGRFHAAFAMFRWAAILDGVRARGLAGNAAADNAEEVGRTAVLMADNAWAMAGA